MSSSANRSRPMQMLWALLMVLSLAGTAQAQLLRNAFAQADPKPAEPIPAAPAEPAAPAADAPAAEADVAVLAIRIKAVQGSVQVRTKETDPWLVAKPGMDLTIGSEIRTGLRSICQFTIDGNHTVTLDRLGVVKVLDAIKKDGKVKTDVGMKYGRTQYKVETGAAEHDSRVHAPAATLAVRGSLIMLEDNDAFGTRAVVDHSQQAIYSQRAPEGSVQIVQIPLQKGTIEQTAQQIGDRPPTAAMIAFNETINDAGGRLGKANELEQQLVGQFPIYNGSPSGGGLPPPGPLQDLAKDTFKDKVVEGGDLISGTLQIFASWSGIDPIVVFAHDPLGGRLSTQNNLPQGFATQVRSDGPAPGFASGGSTDAFLVYSGQVPTGSYNLGISVIGAPAGATSYFIDVLLDNGGSEPINLGSFDGILDASTPVRQHGFGVSSGGAHSVGN